MNILTKLSRNSFLILALVFTQFSLKAIAQEPIEVSSEVSEATVFLRGAQIGREARVTLKRGKNELIFRGLETSINPKSIQVAASQKVIINSVVHQVNYMQEQKNSPELQRLRDSLTILADLREQGGNQAKVLNAEKSMILANQSLASTDQGLSIEELAKASEFFRSRLTDIQTRLFKVTKKERWVLARTKAIKAQMKELNYKANQPSNDIVLVIEAPQATTEKIRLAYIVNDAGWVPGYDLRAKDSQSPIKLEYRADVYQKTGIDWKQVKLTLSSGNPNQGGSQPNLSPWNLYVYQPQVYGNTGGGRVMNDQSVSRSTPAPKPAMAVKKQEKADFGEANTLAAYTKVQETATTAEFEIGVMQDIPSNGKKQQVSIQNSELPAEYQHFAVPKVDKDAFLVARVTDWEKLNLLAGKVNIFFEGTYVAESYIDPSYTQDTLVFSLGRDKKVIVQRDQLKDFNTSRLIGPNRERTFGFEITVRNSKKEAVNLRLEDQIPISQDKSIIVKLEESSSAQYNEASGKLTWDLDLAPMETRKLRLVFSVKYPKDSSPF